MVTPVGIFTDVRLLHLKKDPSPIVVTLVGIFTDVRLLHSLKAPFPIVVTR
ncbi:hypothetical protein FACS1894200_00340 [Spirochaetia bacterium]|nr:hypothetical protein FACS1894200_00340 [Spirochaetia bacterium]